MKNKFNVVSSDEKSADITMTQEYLVVKGKHYRLRDWYIRTFDENVSVPVKDILSMEYLTMRSKRMLVLFIICSGLLLGSGSLFYDVISFTQSIDAEIDEVESVYNAVADNDVDINLTDKLLEGVSGIGRTALGIILFIVCMVLMAGSIGFMFFYAMRPYHFLRISAIGIMIAVEIKHYRKADLDRLCFEWQEQLYL